MAFAVVGVKYQVANMFCHFHLRLCTGVYLLVAPQVRCLHLHLLQPDLVGLPVVPSVRTNGLQPTVLVCGRLRAHLRNGL